MKHKKTIDEGFNKFYSKFIILNNEILEKIDNEYRICPKVLCRKLLIYNDGANDLILPDGYSIHKDKKLLNENSYETYILNKRGSIVCGLYYNESKDSLFTNFEKPYPKENIIPYKEHILEKASIITETYLGEDKEDYLKHAILEMIDGNYNYFPKYDNTRFKLTLIQRSKIPRVMISTLERNNFRFNSSSVSTLTNEYVNYIKNKVNFHNNVKNTNKKLVKGR